MHYLTLSEALELHRRVIGQSGGALGVLNLGALESALAQPRMTFGGKDLYPSVVEKAAALGLIHMPGTPFLGRPSFATLTDAGRAALMGWTP